MFFLWRRSGAQGQFICNFFCSFPLCISDTHIFFTNCVYSTLVHLAITCILCTLFVVMISNIIKLCYTITPKWSVSIKARIKHNRSSVQPRVVYQSRFWSAQSTAQKRLSLSDGSPSLFSKRVRFPLNSQTRLST